MTQLSTGEKPYESLVICPSDTPQKDIDAFVEKIKANLDQTGGSFKSVNVWGRRRLSFPIRRHRDGLFVYLDFNGGSTSVNALNSLYHVTDMVLRSLTVEHEEHSAPRPRSGPPRPPRSAPRETGHRTPYESKSPPSTKKEEA